MNNITRNELNFKNIEREFYEIACEIAKGFMKNFLEELDEELAKNRNKKELRHKGKRQKTIKTLMGEVELKRNIYKTKNEKGEVSHIYLLDKELDFETIGTTSPNLVEKIADEICNMSYRETSKAIKELTNQTISHQGIWDIVQTLGEKQEQIEKQKIKEYKKGNLKGEKEVEVLYEEADGIALSMQQRGKKSKKKKQKKEMKVGIAYEGWEKRHLSSKEYKTVGKTAYAGYLTPKEFSDLRESKIAQKYNTDEIKYRILNGDGASWIKKGYECENRIFQLDPYHISESIIRNVTDKKARKEIKKWLREGKLEKVYKRIEQLKYESGGVVEEINKLKRLESYIKNNEEGILSYKQIGELNEIKKPNDLEKRNLGTMERNILEFAKRMKGAKSWSEKGATNLAKIISLKLEKNFKNNIERLVTSEISERLKERFEQKIINPKDYLKKAKKKKVYPINRGEIPYKNYNLNNSRKAIKSLLNYKGFTELKI